MICCNICNIYTPENRNCLVNSVISVITQDFKYTLCEIFGAHKHMFNHIDSPSFTYPLVWLTVGASLEILQPTSSTLHGSQLSAVWCSIQDQSTLWCCLLIIFSVFLFVSHLILFPVGQSWPVQMIVWRVMPPQFASCHWSQEVFTHTS